MALPKIRRARKSDLETIAELDCAIFQDAGKEEALGNYREVFGKRIPGAFLVAEDKKDGIVGAIATGKITTMFGREAKVESLFVVPRFQGEGLGRRLLERAISEAKKSGVSYISLTVKEDNSRARALYESEKFSVFRLVYRKKLKN